MINIDKQLLEMIQGSTCFGIAHDMTTPECKMCDVKLQCEQKVKGANIEAPTLKVKKERVEPVVPPKSTPTVDKEEVVKTATPKTKTPKADKPASKGKKEPTAYRDDMPDFKQMSLGDLKNMAHSNSVEWTDYGNDQITRMRLIMSLKKLYKL